MAQAVRRVVDALPSVDRSLATGTVLLALAAPQRASAEAAIFVGACTLSIDAAYSPALVHVPGPTSVQLDGSGSCVVNGEYASIALTGNVATTALTGDYGCAGGIAMGTGTVDIDVPGFPNPLVQLAVIDTAGVVTLAAVKTTPNVYTFEGVGELARSPADASVCVLGSLPTTTWEGALAFQDPVLPNP